MNRFDKIRSFLKLERHIPYRILPIVLAISITFVFNIIRTVDVQMTEFHGRAIGHASIRGVDPTVRVSAFWTCIFLFCVVFLTGIFLCGKVRDYLSKKFPAHTFSLEVEMLYEIGMLWLISELIFLYQFVSDRTVKMSPYIIVAVAMVCVHAGFSLARMYIRKDVTIETPLETALVFLLPILCVYFCQLLQVLLSFGTKVAEVSQMSSLVIYFVVYMTMRLIINMKVVHVCAAAYALVPLSFLPMTYIVGNEIQYTLTKHGIVYRPENVSFCLSVALIVMAGALYWRKKNDSMLSENAALKKIENVAVPVLLITLSMFAAHRQTLDPNFDLLHNGNKILPVQQFFQFGKIPYLDVWPHQQLPVLSYLYVLLNGLNYLEPGIWEEMSRAIVYTIIFYFILKQFFGARLSAVLMLFTPVCVYANTYYSTGLLPLVYLSTMRKKRRTIDYAIFFGLALVAFVYHSSSGKIAVIAAVILIFLSCNSKENIISAIKAVVVTAGIPTVVYGILVLLQGEHIADRVSLILALGDSDLLIGSHSTFTSGRTPFEIITYYGFFPLMGILSAIFALRAREKTDKNYSLVFIAVASIICSLRAYARHCLQEGIVIDFYLLLLLIIPCVFIKSACARKTAVFSIMGLLLLIPYASTQYGIAARGIKDFEYTYFNVGDERCNTVDSPSYPSNLRAVLDTVLTKEQTFFETLNAYLLYSLMERENTFLDCSTLLIQYERPQIAYLHKLEKLYEQNKVPIIITGQADQGHPQIDEIPSEMSLFKLEEWIYAHYEPWLWVDGFHLWRAKDSDISIQDDYEQLDNILFSVDYENDLSTIVQEGELVLDCGEADPYVSLMLTEPFDTKVYDNLELRIVYKTSVSGLLQAFYNFEGYCEADSALVNVHVADGYKTVYIPITETTSGECLKKIRIDPPKNALFTIQSMDIVKRDIIYAEKEYIQQDFDMIKLPYVWGNYDEKINRNFPEELQRVAEGVELTTKVPVAVALDASIDKSSGNYIYLRINAKEAGNLTLQYGDDIVNSCHFNIEAGEWDYLVRISTQYNWVSMPQTAMKIVSDMPMTVKQMSVLKGD